MSLGSVARFISVAMATATVAASAVDHQYELHQYLNSVPYDKSLLPLLNASSTVTVNLGIYPGHLMSLDGAKQVLSIAAYILVSWPEQRLQWNPSHFGGVKAISRLPSEVWYPRILLYNGVGTDQWLKVQTPIRFQAVAPNFTFGGFITRQQLDTSCELDMAKFPKDEQICQVDLLVYDEMGRARIGPAEFPDHNDTNYLGLYQVSNEWDLTDFHEGVEVKEFKMSKTQPKMPMPLYSVTFKYRRESQYYIMNIITPVLLLTFLQILVFFVPVESGEKMGLGITILLSFTVFLLLIDAIIPKSRTMPFIGTFITAAMSLSAVSLILSSLVLRLHFMEAATPMPRLVRTLLIRCLATAMLLRPPASMFEAAEMQKGNRNDREAASQQQQQQEAAAAAAAANPWQLAAMAVERLMVLAGIVSIVVLFFVFVLPAVA